MGLVGQISGAGINYKQGERQSRPMFSNTVDEMRTCVAHRTLPVSYLI